MNNKKCSTKIWIFITVIYNSDKIVANSTLTQCLVVQMSKGITLNKGQQAAVDAIRSGRNVFLTGEGGTGKSAAISKAVNLLRHDGRKTIICAPTGVAAQNVHGATIHSAFRFDLAPKVADELESVQPSKVVQEADTIVIDEIGMVRRDLMDAIARVVEIENRRRDNDPELKHLQLVVVGDFSQLPPVVTRSDRPALIAQYGQKSAGSGFYAFEADGWAKMGFEVCQLTEAMRQSDPTFVAMLNRARIGDASCLPYFNHLAERGHAPSEAISLVGTNKAAELTNTRRLDALRGSKRVFDGYVEGKFKPSDMSTQQDLALKLGAHVMTLANNADEGYINGSTGTIVEYDTVDANGEQCIAIKLDSSGTIVNVKRHTWENVEYRVQEKDGKKYLEQEIVGKFVQFPLKLAWAVTFHKSQGQTLESVSIDPSTFVPGQLYVGLSRATSARGIWLTRSIKPKDLIADNSVVKFYEETCSWTAPELATGSETPELTDRPAIKQTDSKKNEKTKRVDTVAVVPYSNPKLVLTGLAAVQEELHELLGAGGRTWVRVYELISRVSREQLYKPDYKSFSAWIKAEAKREGVAESILWHRKSAGDFYNAWASNRENVPTLAAGDKLSEDNLNLVRKITKANPDRGNELMEKIISEGLSTQELRKEWRETRKAKTAPVGNENVPDKQHAASASKASLSISCVDAETFTAVINALTKAGIDVELI